MTTNDSYELETRHHLEEAKTKIVEIESKIKELQTDSGKLRSVISAYETILQNVNKDPKANAPTSVDWNTLLRHKTNRDKVISYAQNTNGKIIMNDLVDVLFDNQLINSQKKINVYIIVNGVINELIKEGKASKIKTGEYYIKQN
jgi:hypothetical protein